MNLKKSKNILVANPFGIGDVLFSTPLVHALREHYTADFIGYICNRRTEPFLTTNPDIDKVFVYEKDEFKNLWSQSKPRCILEFVRLLMKVKRRRFEVLIDLSLGHQYSLISFLMGIRQRIGFNYKNRGKFLTHKIDIEGYDSKHIVDYYLSLLQFLDIKVPESVKLQFLTEPPDREWARDFLKAHNINEKEPIIGIIPGGGASWGGKAAYKHWPEENFSKLSDRLVEEFSAKVIIFGDHQEIDKCNRIASISRLSPVSACGITSLGRFAALLGFCDLAVANDGGPLHVAVSQNVPTVSIFGPVNEVVYGPYPMNENNIVIKEDIDCRPCYRKFKIPECDNRICLQKIGVEDVFGAARQILARRTSFDKAARFIEVKIPLSVVVLTKNEAKNIADCLESVMWADEIIVVDDFSTDQTCQIASKHTKKIFKRKMDVEGIHRNWAYGQAKNKWVLSLDADEMVSSELRNEIMKLFKGDIGFSAFSIPLRNYIGNYWVRYGGWYPAGKVRLFDRDRFRYEEVGVHPRVFIDGECGHLKKDIIHKGYPDFAHFLDSLNRQTTLEAQKWIEDKRKMSSVRMLRKMIDRFFKSYILKKGYKDGFIGFMVAFFASLYQVMSYTKYWELKKKVVKLRIIFIDRDGVINKDLNAYVTGWDKFQFLDGALEALKKLTDRGYEIVILSNQAGIARGDYTVEELNHINKNMLKEIKNITGKQPTTYYCIHNDEDNCSCRKPKTGMFRQAEIKFGRIDYGNTYFIGDQERDVEAARNLGAKSILVLSGKSNSEQLKGWKSKPDYVKKDLLDAVNWLLEKM